MQKILQSDTVPDSLVRSVELLRDKNFKALSESMPISMTQVVKDGMPMVMVSKAAERELIAFIEFELIKLSTMVNIDARLNLQRHQVPLIAQSLYEDFKYESMEDIALCLRRGAMGRYSPEGIFRLDGAVITKWMAAYLEEKYQVVENNINAEKPTPEQKSGSKGLLELYKAVVGDHQAPDESNTVENSYQRWKVDHPYAWYSVYGLKQKVWAQSEKDAVRIVQKLIDAGEIEIVDDNEL